MGGGHSLLRPPNHIIGGGTCPPGFGAYGYERILVEIVVFERGGHFERKFQGNGGHPPTIISTEN